jgi:hypothetical protein
MTLTDFLTEKKTTILERWLDRILEDYPPDTRSFFRETRSLYSNPVGFTLRKGMEGIIDWILQPLSAEEARAILEPVMKVRAVENLSPSQRMKFILPLGEVLGEIMREEDRKDLWGQEWMELNSGISRLALLSMKIFSECREKVNQLRIKESGKRAGEVQARRAEA